MRVTPTAVNMATSIVVIALAVPVVYSLRITKRRKIAAMAVFALGSLYVQPFHEGRSLVDHHPRVCALSGLQLWLQYAAYGSKDITYSDVPTVVCAALEANLTIIAACILAMEPLIARLFPGFQAELMDDAQSNAHENSSDNRIKMDDGASADLFEVFRRFTSDREAMMEFRQHFLAGISSAIDARRELRERELQAPVKEALYGHDEVQNDIPQVHQVQTQATTTGCNRRRHLAAKSS